MHEIDGGVLLTLKNSHKAKRDDVACGRSRLFIEKASLPDSTAISSTA